MSTEHSYIRSIHRKLPRAIHAWKINARFARGVPDAWYSGPGGDLWVEYKYRKAMPNQQCSDGLTALQRQWLTQRHKEGRNVAVIIGCPQGNLIIEGGHVGAGTISPNDDWLDLGGVITWFLKLLM